MRFLQHTKVTLEEKNIKKKFDKVVREIDTLDGKRNKLIDMRLENLIDKADYEKKYAALTEQITEKKKIKNSLAEIIETQKATEERVLEFKRVLQKDEGLEAFDRQLFESIVEKVIIGGVDEEGNKKPGLINFIYKTGITNKQDGDKFRPKRKNARKENNTNTATIKHKAEAIKNQSLTIPVNDALYSHISDEAEKLCPINVGDTCRGYCVDTTPFKFR